MKKILCLISISFLLTSCNDEKKSQANNQPTFKTDFIKVYEGKIDNKYDYYAKLTANNGTINGSYFYKDKCQQISLQGTVDSLGNIKMTEYGANNKMTGIFTGKMVNEQKFEGNWSQDATSKKIPFYFIETNESFDTAIENCSKIRQSKVLKTMVIDNVALLSFPPTKEAGNAWDNALASYKPDIYIKITDLEHNVIYAQTDYYHNKTNEDLPLNFEFKNGLKINEEILSKGFFITFYDFDSATAHDLLGYIELKNDKEHFSSKKTNQEFELKGTKIKLTSHWE